MGHRQWRGSNCATSIAPPKSTGLSPSLPLFFPPPDSLALVPPLNPAALCCSAFRCLVLTIHCLSPPLSCAALCRSAGPASAWSSSTRHRSDQRDGMAGRVRPGCITGHRSKSKRWHVGRLDSSRTISLGAARDHHLFGCVQRGHHLFGAAGESPSKRWHVDSLDSRNHHLFGCAAGPGGDGGLGDRHDQVDRAAPGPACTRSHSPCRNCRLYINGNGPNHQVFTTPRSY